MRSLYELLYIKWSGIDYDREKLNRFILNLKVYRFLSVFSSKFKDQYRKLKVIHGMYDKVKLEKLHNGDEETIRIAQSVTTQDDTVCESTPGT